MLAASHPVRDAFKALNLPFSVASLSRKDFMALLGELLPSLVAAPTRPSDAARLTKAFSEPTVLKASPRTVAQASSGELSEAVNVITQSLERLGILVRGAGARPVPTRLVHAVGT